jgi:hypothetical protein
MTGRFDHVVLLNNGKVRVGGPIDPGPDIDKARVVFLIIQGDGRPGMTILDGRQTWYRDTTKGPDEQRWSVEIDNQGTDQTGAPNAVLSLTDGRAVRGIALAVGIQKAQERADAPGTFDPPAIEALTWCASVPLSQE